MTTEQGPVRRQVDLEIRSAAPVEGRFGIAQWELSAKPPWSKYPFKAWIDRDENSSASIMPGVYPCVVERGGLKDGKAGDSDWDYHWRIRTFNVREDEVSGGTSYDAAGTPTPRFTPARPLPTPGTPSGSTDAPVPRYEDQEIVKRRSIERQQALRLSVDHHAGKDAATDAVILAAETFYSWISGTPATSEATPDDPADDLDLTAFEDLGEPSPNVVADKDFDSFRRNS
jgi:hypothetical protein